MTKTAKKPPAPVKTTKPGKSGQSAANALATTSAAASPQPTKRSGKPIPAKPPVQPDPAAEVTTGDEVDKKKPGRIDLIGLFEAEARALSSAVDRGMLLHATHNIAESGGPLESAVRDFLGRMLPSQYGVEKGYFFAVDSSCTPQIDAMIINMADRHQFLASSDGSVYLPFTASRVVLEIKNSAYDVKKALDQIGAINETLRAMWSAAPPRAGSADNPDLLSVLLFAGRGKEGTLKHVKEWYKQNPGYGKQPTYTVFLDEGIIITRLRDHDVEDYSHCISLTTSAEAVVPYICVPGPDHHSLSGRALLWIYFALVTSLAEAENVPAQILKFADNFQQNFPLFPVIALDHAKGWDSLNTSIRSWRQKKKAHDAKNPAAP